MSLPTGPKYSKAGKELKERLTDDIVGMLNKIKSFLSELQSHSSTTAVKHQPVDLRALPENRKKLEEETKSYQRGTASSLGKSSSSGAKGGKAGGGGAPSNEKYEPPSSDVKADVDAEVYTSMEGCQAMLKEINGFKEYLPEEVVRSYRDSLANMERQWEREQDLGTKAIEEQFLAISTTPTRKVSMRYVNKTSHTFCSQSSYFFEIVLLCLLEIAMGGLKSHSMLEAACG